MNMKFWVCFRLTDGKVEAMFQRANEATIYVGDDTDKISICRFNLSNLIEGKDCLLMPEPFWRK